MIVLTIWLLGALALIVAPRAALLALIGMLVVFDGFTADMFASAGVALYRLPPGIAAFIPVTMAPAGFFALLLAVRLALVATPQRLGAARPLPTIVWLVLPVILLGVLWGLATGGALNLAYHESRGLIVAIGAFVAVRAIRLEALTVARLTFLSTVALAIVIILRYVLITRGRYYGDAPFAHESLIFLAIGCVAGALGYMQARSPGRKALFALYELLLLAAIMCTGRRSGTLVVIVGLLVVAALLFTHRPFTVLLYSTVLALVFGMYLGVYWNSEAGALSQPARAIRSQFQPSPRDLNSDTYRLIETYNVTSTIRSSPLLGVGLGRPFNVLISLWVAPNWSLQFYTPHDNLLWLWLKFGLPGLAVIGGTWLIAMGNVLRAGRARLPRGAIPTYPIAIAASLMIYLQFMQVDVTTTERAMIPFALLLALAMSVPEPAPGLAPEVSPVAEAVPSQRARGERRQAVPRYFPGAV